MVRKLARAALVPVSQRPSFSFQRSTPGPSLGGLLRPRAGALVFGTGDWGAPQKMTAGVGDKERGLRMVDRYKQVEVKGKILERAQ